MEYGDSGLVWSVVTAAWYGVCWQWPDMECDDSGLVLAVVALAWIGVWWQSP
ncbi:hypothetical protein chiPu_0028328, partial [Chiloscyllium punctatum]|nr:hypothetical protein [Chiloscyllium punctatum]